LQIQHPKTWLSDCVPYRFIQRPIGEERGGTNLLYHLIADQIYWYWSELWNPSQWSYKKTKNNKNIQKHCRGIL